MTDSQIEEMIGLYEIGFDIVGTKREAWNHPQRDQAIAWAKSYLDGERAMRAAA